MKSIITINPAPVTTNPAAVTIWNADTQAKIAAEIKAGRGVSKEVAIWVKNQASGRQWLAGQRAERKSDLIKMTGALIGQFTSEGFKITRMGEVKKSERTGNRTVSMSLTQFAETKEQQLRDELEKLRAELNAALAKADK